MRRRCIREYKLYAWRNIDNDRRPRILRTNTSSQDPLKRKRNTHFPIPLHRRPFVFQFPRSHPLEHVPQAVAEGEVSQRCAGDDAHADVVGECHGDMAIDNVESINHDHQFISDQLAAFNAFDSTPLSSHVTQCDMHIRIKHDHPTVQRLPILQRRATIIASTYTRRVDNMLYRICSTEARKREFVVSSPHEPINVASDRHR